jgi:uncharacterized membrane protein YccC
LGNPRPPRHSSRQILSEILNINRAFFAVGPGLRTAVAVGLALATGLITGQLPAAVVVAIGATLVGFVSFHGVYRSRAIGMLVTAVGMTGASVFGGLVGRSNLFSVLAIAVAGSVAGMLVAFGELATSIGRFSVVALLVGANAPSFTAGLQRSGWLLLGGLVVTGLVTAAWPLRRFPAERRAVSAVYWDLSAYAHLVPHAEWATPPDPEPFTAAAVVLDDPQPLRSRAESGWYRELYDQAERLRISLASLARARSRTPSTVDELAELTAETMAAVAAAVADSRPLEFRTTLLAALKTDPAGEAAELSQLRGQLRVLVDSVASKTGTEIGAGTGTEIGAGTGTEIGAGTGTEIGAGTGTDIRTGPGTEPVPRLGVRYRPGGQWLSGQWLTLRANLHLDSAAFRHAVRLAAALGLAAVLSRALPVQQGYWIPLTVLMVLQPDYGATISRGLGRMAGTVLGAGISTAAVAALRPGPVSIVLLAVLFAALTTAVLRVNYALFTANITVLIVLLVSLTGLPNPALVTDRLVDSGLGGLAALLAYLLWPTWEVIRLRSVLAELLSVQAAYGMAVLAAGADPRHRDVAMLRRLRTEARRARTNAEASVERALMEPAGHRRLDPVTAMGVIGAARRYALAVLALHGHLPVATPISGPQLARLTEAIGEVMTGIAAGLRASVKGVEVVTGELPPLDRYREELLTVVDPADREVLASESGEVVASITRIAGLLAPR